MVDIIIIKSNPTIYDVRVRKTFLSLNKKYSTIIFGWNREGKSISPMDYGENVLHLFNLKAPYGKISLVVYLPFFWTWILFKLIMLRPKVVHACDLDTMPASYIYKVLFRKKLVFDVFDRYAMAYVPPKFRMLNIFVNFLEEWFTKRSDVLIAPSEKMLSTFRKKPKLCIITMNCPEDHNVKRVKPSDDLLTLVYTGSIVRNRGLERITEAMKDLGKVEFAIAGRILDKKFFDEIMRLPNVRYEGLLSPIKALELEGNSDVITILYDLSLPINNYAMPNKIFEAMMFGIPTITNVALEVIDEVKCGIKVDYNDLDQIKSAIVSLRDNRKLCETLGTNGRIGFEKKYSWNIMENELFKIYDEILSR